MMVAYLILGAAALASTQSVTSTNESSPTIASTTTHTIAAGEAGLIYTPNTLTANVGDVIEFWFYPQNHSVARAGYEHPCIPYEYTGLNKVGFWSGFQPVNVVLPNPPKFSIVVNDTDPIFFYCSAPGACIEEGMIGVINPTFNQTFETQLAYAKNSTLMFSPGEGYPIETSSPPSPSTAAPLTSPSNYTTISAGDIAGISIGGAVFLGIVGWFCFIRGRKSCGESRSSKAHSSALTNTTQPFPLPPDYYQPPLSPELPSNGGTSYPTFNSPHDRPLSPLISPDQRGQFPFNGTHFPMATGLNPIETAFEPQELAALEPSVSRGRNDNLPKPFSFDDPTEADRANMVEKLSHM